jgi:hypothetical protein
VSSRDTINTAAAAAGGLVVLLIIIGILLFLAGLVFPGLREIWSAGTEAAGTIVGALAVAIVGLTVAVAAAVIAVSATAWITAEIIRSTVRRALDKPQETLIAVAVLTGAVATSIAATAGGYDQIASAAIAGGAGGLALAGELLITRASARWQQIVGWLLTVALPTVVLASAVAPHISEDPLQAFGRVDPVTWALIGAFIAIAITTAILARTLPDPGL